MIRILARPFSFSRSILFQFNASYSSQFIHATDPDVFKSFENSLLIKEDFLSHEEEKSLLDEVDPYMRKLRYEYDHWDSVGIFTLLNNLMFLV